MILKNESKELNTNSINSTLIKLTDKELEQVSGGRKLPPQRPCVMNCPIKGGWEGDD